VQSSFSTAAAAAVAAAVRRGRLGWLADIAAESAGADRDCTCARVKTDLCRAWGSGRWR
jgi:hypothetical protein